MPVRSGPILPPSPECMWHLEQCFLKTPCPARRRRSSSSAAAAHRRPSAGRRWAGRRRARGSPWPARRSAGRGGRPEPASDRATVRRAGTLPLSSASSRRRVQSGRPSSTRRRRGPRRRRQRGKLLEDRPARASAASLVPSASSSPAASSGDDARRDQVEQLLDESARRRAGTRSAARAAATRSPSRALSSATAASSVATVSAACFSKLLLPQAVASLTRLPLAARRQPGRARRGHRLFACPRPASACLACGQPLARPRDDGVGDRRLGVGQRSDDRADRSARRRRGRSARRRCRSRSAPAASAVVLRGDRLAGSARRSSAAALVAASGIQRSRDVLRRLEQRRPRPRPPAASAGMSARASSAASRTCGSVSFSSPAFEHAPRSTSAVRGSTCTALRRTPADGCFSAATAAAVAVAFGAVQRAEAVQRPQGMNRADVQADRVDALVARPASTSAGTTSALPRSTSSRWACRRQNMLSFFSVATSLLRRRVLRA